MTIAMRNWILAGALSGMVSGSFSPLCASAQDKPAAAVPAKAQDVLPGQLTEEQLGKMIEALGLKIEKQQQRFDFAFRANLDDQQWELSMSSVLSQDGKSIWIMAWLDELPKSAADVPRSALLRLLAENDKLGNGKFFAYIANNRRFVLQRVVANENMTSVKFRLMLQDLGTTVVETYPTWSVAGWSGTQQGQPAQSEAAVPATDARQTPPGGAAPTKSATNESKFELPIRK